MYFYTRKYRRKDGSTGTCLTRNCKECCKKNSAKQRKGPKREAYLAYQKEYQATKGIQHRRDRFAWLNQLKASPCGDCGHSFPPECMDFDHIDPSTKLFDVSQAAVGGRSVESVELEIAKCRLICSNCHRIRTAKQNRRGLR